MMITVARFSFPHEAHIVRARLEASGIPAVVADEYTITMQWLYSDALGGVKVQVPSAYVTDAARLLAEENPATEPGDDEEEGLSCPRCGSTDTAFVIRGRRAAFVVFLALHFPLWPYRREIRCRGCGQVSDYPF